MRCFFTEILHTIPIGDVWRSKMKHREKIFLQVIICCAIFTLAKAGGVIDIEGLEGIKTAAKEQFEKNYSIDEVKASCQTLFEKAKETPAVIASAIVQANRLGEYGKPIDEDSDTKERCVYAVSAGEVVASGISKELGAFVKIRHEAKTSTYGNLSEIKVVQGDKVKKGDIIGIYESHSDKEFYYNLEENSQENLQT